MNRTIYVVRHGHHTNGYLDSLGKSQIAVLAKELKLRISEKASLRIISSTAARATESAEIIAKSLNARSEGTDSMLWTGPDGNKSCHLDETLEMINSTDDEVVIMVTHYEYSEEFPSFFASKVWGDKGFSETSLNNGQAWCINCNDNTITLISPNLFGDEV
jgi:broad specificity phosphatase PhoE